MNIALIRMPGSGKSTIGAELAKMLSYNFIDIDKIIEDKKRKSLQSILDEIGDSKFIALEEEVIIELKISNSVLSPGGSAVYSDRAMRHLKSISKIVFLDVQLQEIKKRVSNISARGIVGLRNKTIDDVYRERLPLYKQYADYVITPQNSFYVRQIALSILEITGAK